MISKPVKKFAIAGLMVSALIAGIPIAIHFGRPYFFKHRLEAARSEQLALQAKRKTIPPITATSNATLPETIKLEVPFTPQAPTANWDELHNEACEEASSIMANAYYNGTDSLTPEFVETEITRLSTWQDENLGYHMSINTPETQKMIEGVYGLKTITAKISEDAIKSALANNRLVMVPANGQLLHNPNYKQPGPIYHMLLITGYNEKGFITNDSGTRKGLDYFYDYKTLYEANGNWDHGKDAVNLQDKQIIIISK